MEKCSKIVRFLWMRAHDLCAIVLLVSVYHGLGFDRWSRTDWHFWQERFFIAHDQSLWIGWNSLDEWSMWQGFLTQGKHPFCVNHGGRFGPFEAFTATNGTDQRWLIAVSYWFVISVSGIPLVASVAHLPRDFREARERIRQRWKQYYRKPDFCVKCGYDLRATPTRCPECGYEVKNLEEAALD